MDIRLDAAFISGLSSEPYNFTFQERTFTLIPSTERRGLISAEAQVVENDITVGYLTKYSTSEVGACKADMFGTVAPHVFGELSGAMRELVGNH